MDWLLELIDSRIDFLSRIESPHATACIEELRMIRDAIHTTSSDGDLTPYKVWEWWNGKVGMVPGRMPGKAARSAKLLLDRGATFDDLDALWDWLKADPWWSKHGIDLGMMVAAYDKWLAAKAVGSVEDTPATRRWRESDGRL